MPFTVFQLFRCCHYVNFPTNTSDTVKTVRYSSFLFISSSDCRRRCQQEDPLLPWTPRTSPKSYSRSSRPPCCPVPRTDSWTPTVLHLHTFTLSTVGGGDLLLASWRSHRGLFLKHQANSCCRAPVWVTSSLVMFSCSVALECLQDDVIQWCGF